MYKCHAAFVGGLLFAAIVPGASARAQSTAFTYQASLHEQGVPASGTYDVQFKLFDDELADAQQGATVCVDGVNIQDGLLTVQIDFGVSVFDGADRWLEIGVRSDDVPANCNSGVFTTLSPRQPLAPTPYALQTRGLFVDASQNVGIGIVPQAKLNVGGDVRIDDGTINVRSGGSQVYQLLGLSQGVAAAFTNKSTGSFALAVGTANDGSGFLDAYGKTTNTLTAELDADIDHNQNNGIDAGGLFLRSKGTGGPGGQVTIQNNDGVKTLTIEGGATNSAAVFSLFNTTGSTTVRALGDVNSLGGELRTADASGNAQFVAQPDFNGGGTYLSLARSSGSNGLVFDGNTSGSGNPTLTLSSSVSPVTINTNATGNAAVVLPNDAISAAEILDEPGVANNHGGSSSMLSTVSALLSRSITVPAAGFVLALAQGDLEIGHVTGTTTDCAYGVSKSATSLPIDQDVQTLLPSALPSGTYDFSASAHGLFSVDGPGTFTFFFDGSRSSGSANGHATMFDLQLTLVYFPTAYGSTSPNAAASQTGGSELLSADAGRRSRHGTTAGDAQADAGATSVRPPLSVEEIDAEQADAAAFAQARLDRELELMHRQMAALQDHLKQVEAEQRTLRDTPRAAAAVPIGTPNLGGNR